MYMLPALLNVVSVHFTLLIKTIGHPQAEFHQVVTFKEGRSAILRPGEHFSTIQIAKIP